MEKSDLEISYYLDKILKYLKDSPEPLSRTILKNAVGISIEDAQAALEYGEREGVLRKGEFAKYSAIGDFSIREEKFYPAVTQALRTLWLQEGFQETDFRIEITSGKRTKIAGPWTRPDITLISYKKFPWTFGGEFDVVTFEVKRPDNCNVLAVFEALSHAAAATRTYVVFPIGAEEWSRRNAEQVPRVKDECSKYGVGLILIEDVYQMPEPKLVIKATKREIDHEKCNSFLAAVMPEAVKAQISAWK